MPAGLGSGCVDEPGKWLYKGGYTGEGNATQLVSGSHVRVLFIFLALVFLRLVFE
jgi:hypothetical protein